MKQLCRNGLHEKTRPGRCLECKRAKNARNNLLYFKTEKGRTAQARYSKSKKGRARYARFQKKKTLIGSSAERHARDRKTEKGREWQKRRNAVLRAKRASDPSFRQMENDCRRLGLSRAEWRRQVEQGIITINDNRRQ